MKRKFKGIGKIFFVDSVLLALLLKQSIGSFFFTAGSDHTMAVCFLTEYINWIPAHIVGNLNY